MSVARVVPRPATDGVAYEDDFYTWSQEQAARLRAGAFANLDLENLAEEIESLGKSQFSTLASALRIVLLHMLKFDHQPGKRTRSWAISIATHREHAAHELKVSPGLKSRMAEAVAYAYRRARIEAAGETRMAMKRFPETCPYTPDEIMDRPFPIDADD